MRASSEAAASERRVESEGGVETKKQSQSFIVSFPPVIAGMTMLITEPERAAEVTVVLFVMVWLVSLTITMPTSIWLYRHGRPDPRDRESDIGYFGGRLDGIFN